MGGPQVCAVIFQKAGTRGGAELAGGWGGRPVKRFSGSRLTQTGELGGS